MLGKKRSSPVRAAFAVTSFNAYSFMGAVALDLGFSQELPKFEAASSYRDSFRVDDADEYMFRELLKRFPYKDGPAKAQLEKDCVSALVKSEFRVGELNRSYEEDFRFVSKDDSCPQDELDAIMLIAQGKFLSLFETITMDTVIERSSLTGGATSCTPRKFSSPALKVALKRFSISRRLRARLERKVSTFPFLREVLDSSYSVVASRFTTVPKTSFKRRGIAAEPTLNVFIQRGVGLCLRDALRSKGIDLTDQSRNKNLARKGSIDGSVATLDMRDASDSVSEALVHFLSGAAGDDTAWDILHSSRVDFTRAGSVLMQLQMYSSMGNGYTFELESSIFWALVQACAIYKGVALNCTNFGIYGDDIVCPVELVPTVIGVLSSVGFLVNAEKSYWDGPFRESCGGSYVGGSDITPVYIRELKWKGWDQLAVCKLWNQLYLYFSRRYPWMKPGAAFALMYPNTHMYLMGVRLSVPCELRLPLGLAPSIEGYFLDDYGQLCDRISVRVKCVEALFDSGVCYHLLGSRFFTASTVPVKERITWARPEPATKQLDRFLIMEAAGICPRV